MQREYCAGFIWRDWWKLWPRLKHIQETWPGGYEVSGFAFTFGPFAFQAYTMGKSNG